MGVIFTRIFYLLFLNTENGYISTDDHQHFRTNKIQTAKDKIELNILTNSLHICPSVMLSRLSSSMLPLEICRSCALTPAGFSCASCKALLPVCSLLFPAVGKLLAVLHMLSQQGCPTHSSPGKGRLPAPVCS